MPNINSNTYENNSNICNEKIAIVSDNNCDGEDNFIRFIKKITDNIDSTNFAIEIDLARITIKKR